MSHVDRLLDRIDAILTLHTNANEYMRILKAISTSTYLTDEQKGQMLCGIFVLKAHLEDPVLDDLL